MTGKRNSVLWLMALCAFFAGWDSIVTVPLLPAMAETVHLPAGQGAVLVTAYALAYTVTAPLFGAISDRRGRKPMIQLGLLVLGLATALTGWIEHVGWLMAMRALAGVGAGILQPAVFALISDRYPYEQRGRAIGFVMASLVASTLIGVPVGTYLAALASWQWTFAIMGILILLMLPVIRMRLPDVTSFGQPPAASAGSLTGNVRQAVTNRSVLFALLVTLLWFGGMQGMFANSGAYYYHLYRLDVDHVGWILFAAGLGSVIGSLLGGRAADRLGKKSVIVAASLTAAVGVLWLSLITGDVTLSALVHIGWATSFGIGEAALTALISELYPKVRGTVLSLNSSAMYAGMTAATAMSAVLLNGMQFWRVGFMCALATILVLPITLLLVKPRSPQQAQAETPHR